MAPPSTLLVSPAREASMAILLEDRRLAERVECTLCASGYGLLGRVKVTAQARHIRLSGRVPTYFLKQVAQETALAVVGVEQVCNDLDVVRTS